MFLDTLSDKNYKKDMFDAEIDEITLPKTKFNEESISAQDAYNLIKDELLSEGNARLNLATFCQTSMEDEAIRIMAETLEKNAIDKSEYPKTAELENRCVDMLGDLWNADTVNEKFIGTSTVGSSEACMLAGMAMKFRWRHKAEALGLQMNKKPNIVISSAFQVCWEKFCVYFDIELREVPINKNVMSLDVDNILDYIDDYTIGVVGILGLTYTGKFDDIEKLDTILTKYNETAKISVPIHVDGASGGLFTPFVDPDLRWDFRLKNVVSISTSGHKYGLVYPGIGWVVWRDKEYLPKELIFEVSYLGGHMPTMAINFSRSASQIIGQYYTFLRFGFDGYKKIHTKTKNIALFISNELEKLEIFEIYNDGSNLPIVCYKLKENISLNWSLYDLSDRLLMKGWQIPSYPLPSNLSDTVIQRIVCRADLSHVIAEQLIKDIRESIISLNEAKLVSNEPTHQGSYGFTH